MVNSTYEEAFNHVTLDTAPLTASHRPPAYSTGRAAAVFNREGRELAAEAQARGLSAVLPVARAEDPGGPVQGQAEHRAARAEPVEQHAAALLALAAARRQPGRPRGQ